ncbi:cytochrome c oxidase subunit 5A, mitochondrial, partial [Armadillidium vulgare]
AMNDLCGMDLVPEPKIVIAALKACRRLNDIALAIEIRPTLDELGINTPEELGYDKPELALPIVYDVHG